MQSSVYQVDAERVVKIRKAASFDSKALVELLENLQSAQLPFDTPQILQHGRVGTVEYSVEKLMAGKPLREIFPTLSPEKKIESIRGVIKALSALHNIRPSRTFGDWLETPSSITAETWTEYVVQKIDRQYAAHRQTLEADVPSIRSVRERFSHEVSQLDSLLNSSIVHGDIFFPNIMVHDDGSVGGIIDFSELTVVGDPMLDMVSLAIFARKSEGASTIHAELADIFGEYFLRCKRLYSILYAFRFAGCKEDDPETYQWCLGQLRRYLIGSPHSE